MSQQELRIILIIAVLVGFVFLLAILIKLWKQIIVAVIIVAVIGFFLCTSGKIQCPLDDLFLQPSTPHDRRFLEIEKPHIVKPDLDVEIVSWPSREFSCDKQFSLDVMVRNFGKGTARNIEIVNYNPRINWRIHVLEPGSSKQKRFFPRLTGWRRGHGLNNYEFQFFVDPNQIIMESNENNNNSIVKRIQCF